MNSAVRRGAVVVLSCMVAACMAAFVVSLPPPWPLELRQARQRWAEQQVHHYQVEVMWADGWSLGHARVEMRDGQLIAATDLTTGQPLAPNKRLAASYFASVDQLFALVEKRVWPSMDWRILVSRYHPTLERWLQPCIAPLSAVTFDGQQGYPSDISYNNSWCNETTFYTYSNVKLTNLTPLP